MSQNDSTTIEVSTLKLGSNFWEQFPQQKSKFPKTKAVEDRSFCQQHTDSKYLTLQQKAIGTDTTAGVTALRMGEILLCLSRASEQLHTGAQTLWCPLLRKGQR